MGLLIQKLTEILLRTSSCTLSLFLQLSSFELSVFCNKRDKNVAVSELKTTYKILWQISNTMLVLHVFDFLLASFLTGLDTISTE